jgi:predicted Zn-ribbon and HTH transcriptional regulator
MSQPIKLNTYSAVEWTKAGFSVVSDEEYQKRSEICNSCEFFDKTALFGDGQCNKCGCNFKTKSKIASESCPEDKWGPAEVFKL